MLQVLSNSSIFLLMMLLGYLLKEHGILGVEQRQAFSFLLLKITIPCAILANFDPFIPLGILLITTAITMLGCLALDVLAALLSRGMSGADRASAVLLSNGYQAAGFTLPFVQVNMAASATSVVAAFDIGQGFFNIGINYAIATMFRSEDKKMRLSPLMVLKIMVRSPIMLTYFLVLILVFFQQPIPGYLHAVASKVGAANTFIAMLYAGMVLDFHLDRRALKYLFQRLGIRYLGALLVGILCFFVLPVERVIAQVILLGFLSPVSSAAVVYQDLLGCDMRVAGAASSLSYVISMLAYTVLFLVWA